MTTIGERWNRGDSKNHMILAQIEDWFHAGIAGIQAAVGHRSRQHPSRGVGSGGRLAADDRLLPELVDVQDGQGAAIPLVTDRGGRSSPQIDSAPAARVAVSLLARSFNTGGPWPA